MQPESVLVLDLDQIRAVVGTTTFQRGLDYFHQGAVRKFEWNEATQTLEGGVVGNEEYVSTVFLSRRTHNNTTNVVTILRGICTCPVRMNCKHVAALVIAAAERSTQPPAPKNWEDSIQALLRPHPAEPDTSSVLGIQFTLRTNGPRNQLLVKPVQPGTRGWISGGLAWNKLGSSYQHPAQHIRILNDMHLLVSARTAYRHYSATDLDLSDFPSPGLWALLAEARNAGIPLLHAKPNLGQVTIDDGVDVCLDVTNAPDNGLQVTPRPIFTKGGERTSEPAPPIWGTIGSTTHGIYTVGHDGRIRLAPLNTSVSPALEDFINSGEAINVPAEHRDTSTLR